MLFLRPSVGCIPLPLLLTSSWGRRPRLFPRRRPHHSALPPRHAIVRHIDARTQPRPTGITDAMAGAPRFTLDNGATYRRANGATTSLPTAKHARSRSSCKSVSALLFPVPVAPCAHPTLSPPEHPASLHLRFRTPLLLLPPVTCETVGVAAEPVASKFSRTTTLSVTLLPNLRGRVDVLAKLAATINSRTPTATRRVGSGFPSDAVDVDPHFDVITPIATPTPSAKLSTLL
jgi:hypothetical protein